jgi:plastocyanin
VFCPFTQLRSRIALTAIVALLISCGGSGDGGQNPPPAPVLTTLEVSPTSAALYNTAPGNTVALTFTAKDQNGVTMVGAGSPTFVSSNTGVATVSSTGAVTAVAAGTAQITATLQVGSVTKTAPASITVQVPPALANVGSSGIPQPSFVPAQAHLSAGGDVTWSLTGPEHSVTFVSVGSPANIPSLINASDSRTFPSSGTFNYKCDFHPTMTGTVYVH